jgi:hypothetical protein
MVASLFEAAGLVSWRPPRGDTSNRIDLILIDSRDSLPVEIKSRTESEAINIKSVQQALENRVVLNERKFAPAVGKSASLVVGFSYPPSRSEVLKLVDDIWEVFTVRIGLISLSGLFDLALRATMQRKPTSQSDLNNLRGCLK